MDELTAKFLPRFASLARDRLRNALEVGVDRRPERASVVVHDMHAMAGEAGLLGLGGVIDIARAAEEAARQFGGTGADGDAVALVECLKRLEKAVNEATSKTG